MQGKCCRCGHKDGLEGMICHVLGEAAGGAGGVPGEPSFLLRISPPRNAGNWMLAWTRRDAKAGALVALLEEEWFKRRSLPAAAPCMRGDGEEEGGPGASDAGDPRIITEDEVPLCRIKHEYAADLFAHGREPTYGTDTGHQVSVECVGTASPGGMGAVPASVAAETPPPLEIEEFEGMG